MNVATCRKLRVISYANHYQLVRFLFSPPPLTRQGEQILFYFHMAYFICHIRSVHRSDLFRGQEDERALAIVGGLRGLGRDETIELKRRSGEKQGDEACFLRRRIGFISCNLVQCGEIGQAIDS